MNDEIDCGVDWERQIRRQRVLAALATARSARARRKVGARVRAMIALRRPVIG